ncbi:hypothetical protein ACTWQF_17415 [Streptomyces sp. 8N114]
MGTDIIVRGPDTVAALLGSRRQAEPLLPQLCEPCQEARSPPSATVI